MSELTMHEGAITAGAGVPVGAAVGRPYRAAWHGSGLHLPLAGAVLLHLAVLALALIAPGLGGRVEKPAEVYPVRLYSVAEVEAAVPEAAPLPVSPPARRLPDVVTARVEAPMVVPRPEPPAPEAVPAVTGSVVPATATVLLARTPVASVTDLAPHHFGGDLGAAGASGPVPSLPVEAAAGSGAVASPATVSGGEAGPDAAVPVVLARPLYRRNPELAYPPAAQRRGLEGTVVLEALITPEGMVGGLAVHQSSGHPLLDVAALKSVKGWLFEPGRRGATPVAMKVLVPVRFGLR